MILSCTLFPAADTNVYLRYVNPDGEPVHLINNPNATDPTYDQLVSFITNDTTDTKRYVTGSYVCSNYAEDVHNHAEAQGLRCGWVAIDFIEDTSGHSCNAFNTSDRGLVFIDCTGSKNIVAGDSYDTVVDLAAGNIYQSKSIYATYDGKYSALGVVKKYKIYW